MMKTLRERFIKNVEFRLKKKNFSINLNETQSILDLDLTDFEAGIDLSQDANNKILPKAFSAIKGT